MTRCVGDLVTIFLLIRRKINNLIRFKNLFVARNIADQGHQLDFNRRLVVQRSILKVIVEVAHLLEKSVRVHLLDWLGPRMEESFSYSMKRRCVVKFDAILPRLDKDKFRALLGVVH